MLVTRFPPKGTRRAGLTLVELLVTFVVLSLLVGLVLEGLSLFSSRYETVTRHFRAAASQTLAQQWFATSVRGVVAYGADAHRFRGDTASFVGITLEPLLAEPGTPVTVRWSIENDEVSSNVVYAEYSAIVDPTTATPAVKWGVYDSDEATLSFQYAAGAPAGETTSTPDPDADIEALLNAIAPLGGVGPDSDLEPPAWLDVWPEDEESLLWTPRLIRMVEAADHTVWLGRVESAAVPVPIEEDFR